ncbi:50S ribosomal protein L25/general stress protein Ctc [Bacillus thermotolerans]|uniref:Large ribosomal subunit protein bL25 n=1 Tax=Bacillus thermotolerans TaxID=1221996 RepID=A0A0F5HQH0_BACTR|nr:50S ribosomal protein L25/general stress protein Ctc [Bacillus thermotolerans]KKB35290.1 LSU ribosomal protein L25p [Bacillus thermotolerans]KKB39402.1 LSU ribosomal protein L25p [Bacillus thermotolerans]KKB42803.1 LSU ribosomal protein L25p [Bacillus thermotolerans]
MSTVLETKKRNDFQRSAKTQLREEGLFPAVVYGKGTDPEAIAVSESDFLKTIKEVGRNGVISLNVGGNKHNVILHDYQEDPIKGQIIHADFLAVDLSSEVTVDARVDLEGEAAGTKEGGVIQQPLFTMSVTAKVSEAPDAVAVDVSSLGIGDSLTVGDIRDRYSFTIEHEDEEVIVSVLAPTLEAEDSGTEEEEADEAEADTPETEEDTENTEGKE